MKPRITPVIVAACLTAFAAGIVWNRMRGDDSPAADGAVESRAGKASQRETSQPAGESATGPEAAAVGEPDRRVVQGLETASRGFEGTSRQLVADFGLSAAQAGRLKEVFNRREEQLEALLAGEAGEAPGAVGRICELIRNKGLRDDLVGILSPQQLAAYDENEEKRGRENAEARAYRDMAEVSSVVRLTDDQKQAVLGALKRVAPEKLEKEADARAFVSLFYGPMASGMSPADIRSVANMINIDPTGTGNFDPGSMEHLRRIEQWKAERIDHEIAALRGVLDEDQLARYREHLEKEAPR
jgi:hypothetical protein